MDLQISAALAVYASMTSNLIQTLVHRGALSPPDGKAIVEAGIDLLRQAPTQGQTTDAALAGLQSLLRSIDPAPRDPRQA